MLGFATAIDVAFEMVRNDLVNKISTDVAKLHVLLEPQQVAAIPESIE